MDLLKERNALGLTKGGTKKLGQRVFLKENKNPVGNQRVRNPTPLPTP